MSGILRWDRAGLEAARAHLFGSANDHEQAVFLFANPLVEDEHRVLEVTEAYHASPRDFARQYSDYLELSDEARRGVIKRAYQLKASMVEIHSHLGEWPAAFSYADLSGLDETVPHIWWRLQERPYLALVFTDTAFDALLWWDSPNAPEALSGIMIDDELLAPTNLTLQYESTRRAGPI